MPNDERNDIETADEPYRCNRCEAVFEKNRELQRHRAEKHGEEIAEALRKADPEVRRIERM